MELKLNFELKLPKSSGEPMGIDLSFFTVLHRGEKTQMWPATRLRMLE